MGLFSRYQRLFSDIKDFFPSTPGSLIERYLSDLRYSESASKIISQLCCYKNNLAQGAPSSPVLSNLVMNEIDSDIHKLSISLNVQYSRYADDIVFSGQDDFPEILKENVKSIFKESCWKLSPQKEYLAALPQRLKVHGLLVDQDKPRLSKGYRNKVRAYKHMLNNNKVQKKDLERLLGHVNYSDSVEKFEK